MIRKKMILVLIIFGLVGGVNALFYHSNVLDINVLADDLTIQQMVDNAAPGSTVNLDSKIYSGDGNYNIVVNKNLTIDGNGATIDADSLGRIFTINENCAVKINNLKLINGIAYKDLTGDQTGGAVINSGSLVISNCTLDTNNAIDDSGQGYNVFGGAIFSNSTGNLTIDSSVFTNNFARNAGAGIAVNGSDCNVTNSKFINNVCGVNAWDGWGGAILNQNGDLKTNNCSFIENSAYTGAAISMAGSEAKFTVDSSVFNGNYADYSGGAIDSTGYGNISNSNFINNHADNITDGNSGAVCNNNVMTIRNCNFVNNSASNGGAIRNQPFVYKNTLSLDIFNSNFTNNTAIRDGGAIDIGATVNNITNLNISHSNFKNNKASNDGGAINNQNFELNVSDSQFNDNIAGSGGAIHNNAILNIVGSNLTGNKATAGGYYYGGGGAIKNLGILNINSSNFNSNQAKSSVNSAEVNRGGAIATSNDTEITDSKFIDNKADSVNSRGGGDGSGGAIKTWNKCKFLVKDTTFDSNSASYRGGAIDFDDSISREGRSTDAVAQGTKLDANLVNVNFNNNKANVGGAIELCNGVISATGVKFTGNSASDQGGALDIRGVDYSSSFNILDVNSKHFSDFFTGNSAGLGKSVLIYMGQYLNPGFICDEGVNSGEILKDYYSTWK